MLFLQVASFFYQIGRAFYESQWVIVIAALIAAPLGVLLWWLVFITCMAGLELIRVVIKIEDNSSR